MPTCLDLDNNHQSNEEHISNANGKGVNLCYIVHVHVVFNLVGQVHVIRAKFTFFLDIKKMLF